MILYVSLIIEKEKLFIDEVFVGIYIYRILVKGVFGWIYGEFFVMFGI